MLYEPGMFARSLAGHDEGTIYVILKSEGDLLYLVDGRLKTLEKPKKKKKKHVQLIKETPDWLIEKITEGIRNEDIKRAIGGITHVESRCN